MSKLTDLDCPHCPGIMIVTDIYEYEEVYTIRCNECGYYTDIDLEEDEEDL